MKIAYISQNSFSDLDISLLSELQNKADVYYFIPLRRNRLNRTAINITKQYPINGIFNATIYPELSKFSKILDLSKVYVVNSCTKTGWDIRNIYLNLKFAYFLYRNKFDIIHLTMFPCYYEMWQYIFRKKILLTVHDPFPHSSDVGSIINCYRRIAFRFLSKFLILNKAQKNEFVERYHLKNKQIYISRLGCYSYLRIYDKAIINQIGDSYVLFFGRITPYKGIEYLLEAMEIVHEKYPNVKLVIAGKGNFHFNISKYKSLAYIQFENRFIPDEELACLIKNSLFVVCPYTDATQSGVVMSAYAFEKPVIATNTGGLPEMVLHNKYGIIIQPKSINDLYEGMNTLLGNDNILSLFSTEIKRDYFEGINSWKIISQELYEIYTQILKY